jgi:hypothetical protein
MEATNVTARYSVKLAVVVVVVESSSAMALDDVVDQAPFLCSLS